MPTTARSLASTMISQPPARSETFNLPGRCGSGALSRPEFSGQCSAPQRFNQLRTVHFAGGFTGGDEDFHGAIVNARDLATGQAFGVEFTFSGVIWVIDAHILPAILRRLGHLPDSGLDGARNSEEAELVSPRRAPSGPSGVVVPALNSSVWSKSFSNMYLPGEK